MKDLPVSLSIFREASDPYWKFVTLNIKKDMGEIIVVVLVLYVFCKIVKGIFGGFSKSSLGQFTRNYTQTVKRAADNKRRYAPGEGSIPPVLLSGVSKGVPPLAHDFACKV